MKDHLIKAGEFMGFPIYIDTSMRPDQAKMVSVRWDEFTRRLVGNEVHIINLAPLDELREYSKAKP